MTPRPIDVGPLLNPTHFAETLEKAGRGLALVAVLVLATVFISIFLAIR
jgi:hypothetical protein